jgi:hypothetical protein
MNSTTPITGKPPVWPLGGQAMFDPFCILGPEVLVVRNVRILMLGFWIIYLSLLIYLSIHIIRFQCSTFSTRRVLGIEALARPLSRTFPVVYGIDFVDNFIIYLHLTFFLRENFTFKQSATLPPWTWFFMRYPGYEFPKHFFSLSMWYAASNSTCWIQ